MVDSETDAAGAAAPAGNAHRADMLPRPTEPSDEGHYLVNPLQQLIAQAMAAAGMPLEQRGSKAELSRRSGVEDAIISNIFNRPRYVPEPAVRESIARALGIAPHRLDAAAAEIKGLRVYPAGERPLVKMFDEARDTLILASDELSDEDVAAIEQRIAQIQEDLLRRTRSARRTGE